MPDIKSALSAALNEWDDYIETNNQQEKQVQNQPKKHLFKPTNNVTRSTFDLIRANPGITRKEACKLLDKQGYKVSSTASLISAFIRQGQVELTDGKMFTTSNDYVPLKAGLDVRKTTRTKAYAKVVEKMSPKPAKKDKPIEAAPQPQPTGITKVQSAWTSKRSTVDMEEWLNEVPLMQARLVYMRLKFIFEGETK